MGVTYWVDFVSKKGLSTMVLRKILSQIKESYELGNGDDFDKVSKEKAIGLIKKKGGSIHFYYPISINFRKVKKNFSVSFSFELVSNLHEKNSEYWKLIKDLTTLVANNLELSKIRCYEAPDKKNKNCKIFFVRKKPSKEKQMSIEVVKVKNGYILFDQENLLYKHPIKKQVSDNKIISFFKKEFRDLMIANYLKYNIKKDFSELVTPDHEELLKKIKDKNSRLFAKELIIQSYKHAGTKKLEKAFESYEKNNDVSKLKISLDNLLLKNFYVRMIILLAVILVVFVIVRSII